MHAAGRVGHGRPRDQPVVESLVIPFQMLMRDKLRDRASEVPLPQRKLNDEDGVIRHQPARRPHFGCEEVRRGDDAPVRLEKRLP